MEILGLALNLTCYKLILFERLHFKHRRVCLELIFQTIEITGNITIAQLWLQTPHFIEIIIIMNQLIK